MTRTPSSPDTSGLNVEQLSVRFGAHTVVNSAHLRVAQGDIVALLGPSGCGKSTLLRAIAGLEPLSAGHVWWGGQELTNIPAHERRFGLMFQDGQLFTHLSVAENIGYGLRMRGVPKRERRKRVDTLLEMVHLEGFGTRPVSQLSGGQRQRVALVRSLAPQPQLLMLDEPLTALDTELREHLAVEIRELLNVTGTTAIVVTHDEQEARTIADRIIRMRDGVLAS